MNSGWNHVLGYLNRKIDTGVNNVELSMKMSIYAEIAPVYILGDFYLQPASRGWQKEPISKLELGS